VWRLADLKTRALAAAGDTSGDLFNDEKLLAERYDLSNRPAKAAVMDRAKPVQEGVRVKLPSGVLGPS
jgi:hypothetical protein